VWSANERKRMEGDREDEEKGKKRNKMSHNMGHISFSERYRKNGRKEFLNVPQIILSFSKKE
jgi:hypothetical protein